MFLSAIPSMSFWSSLSGPVISRRTVETPIFIEAIGERSSCEAIETNSLLRSSSSFSLSLASCSSMVRSCTFPSRLS